MIHFVEAECVVLLLEPVEGAVARGLKKISLY